MAITPWYLGETRPTWSLTWTDDAGAAINLTGATVAMRIRQPNTTTAPGAGVVNVTNAVAGQFTYAVAALDFPVAGSYTVQASAVYGDGTVLKSDAVIVTVLPSV